jgi:hypothetical protein
MLRARGYRGTEVFYMLGLLRENIERLDTGEPIIFSGHDLKLPDHHFLIAAIPPGIKPAPTAEIKRRLGLDEDAKLHALFFQVGMLAALPGGEIELPRAMIELPGPCIIVVAESMEALSARVGVQLRAPEKNEQLRLNPLTGKLESFRTDN